MERREKGREREREGDAEDQIKPGRMKENVEEWCKKGQSLSTQQQQFEKKRRRKDGIETKAATFISLFYSFTQTTVINNRTFSHKCQ